jgi:molecular chaperone HscB
LAWREALDDADSRAAVEALAGELQGERDAAYARLADALDGQRDFARAAREVRALMFVERFAADVGDRLVALEP